MAAARAPVRASPSAGCPRERVARVVNIHDSEHRILRGFAGPSPCPARSRPTEPICNAAAFPVESKLSAWRRDRRLGRHSFRVPVFWDVTHACLTSPRDAPHRSRPDHRARSTRTPGARGRRAQRAASTDRCLRRRRFRRPRRRESQGSDCRRVHGRQVGLAVFEPSHADDVGCSRRLGSGR